MDRSGDLGDVRNGWVLKGVNVLPIENSRRMREALECGEWKGFSCAVLPKCYACWPILGNSLRSLTISGGRQDLEELGNTMIATERVYPRLHAGTLPCRVFHSATY